jgi:hypothetical protein
VPLERLRYVLEEDEPEHDVLVLGWLDVLAQLVGRLEQLGREAEVAVAPFRSRHRYPPTFDFRPFSDRARIDTRQTEGRGIERRGGLAVGAETSAVEIELRIEFTRSPGVQNLFHFGLVDVEHFCEGAQVWRRLNDSTTSRSRLGHPSRRRPMPGMRTSSTVE